MSHKIISEEFLTYDDVLIYPKFSAVASRRIVNTSKILQGIHFKVPVLSANMVTVFSEELAHNLHKQGGVATLHQFDSVSATAELFLKLKQAGVTVLPAVGTSGDTKERTNALISAGAECILVDTPHAHNQLTKDFLTWYKGNHAAPIWVGNVATAEAAKDLIQWGATGIKVGIGPGYACTTRVQTGVGVPQLTAVLAVVEEARKHQDIVVIADGGVTTPGQFAKAIGAGADLVMTGNLFAGTDESPGHIIEKDGKLYKEYFGSASSRNRDIRTTAHTSQGHKTTDYVEGAAGLVVYRGSVEGVVTSLQHGLQSAMSYVGATNLMEYTDRVQFIKITHASQIEGGARVL